MKTFAPLLLFLASAVAVQGQGTVQFINVYATGVVNAPVYQSDGVTKCSGSQFLAELLAGPSPDNLVSVAMTGFLSGTYAGYFLGGVVTVPTVFYGTMGYFQVDVWNTANGATFAQAKASGLPNSWWQSAVFTEYVSSPFPTPTPPPPLDGLGTSPVYLNSVPEPFPLALVGCGLIAGLFRKGLTSQ